MSAARDENCCEWRRHRGSERLSPVGKPGRCRTPPFTCERLTQRRATARLMLHVKASNCDGFLESRARQVQGLVMPQAHQRSNRGGKG